MSSDPVGSGWIRNFFLDQDPELCVSDPNPDRNEKTDKLSKLYFFFALIVQKIQWNVSLAVGFFLLFDFSLTYLKEFGSDPVGSGTFSWTRNF